jgi:hypothetical protein
MAHFVLPHQKNRKRILQTAFLNQPLLSGVSIAMLLSLLLNWPTLMADQGHPVAIKIEPQGTAIETMGGFRIFVNATDKRSIEIQELSDLNTLAFQPAHVIHLENSKQTKVPNTWQLFRRPSELMSTLSGVSGQRSPAANDVDAVTICTKRMAGKNGFITRVDVDGVSIIDLGNRPLDAQWIKNLESCDVVVATACSNVNNTTLQQITDAAQPQFILIAIGHNDVESPPTQRAIQIVDHNTIAVASKIDTTPGRSDARWIKMASEPWKIEESDLASLFGRKEAAAAASRSVFKNLSVDQMNFVPGDGSHTARWNSEHMMGRELLFFSQIYHHVDPTITVVNLNPKQMPADYVAAHPDWSGQQEALLTLQVEAFSRRFAYLMRDLPLDEKTQGSKMWSPRSLLLQMERHYNQHTGNVKKKMMLSNWPPK